ncbi:hypothetical protein HII31_13369 [Pseudocercospora fuligena]|uniref:DUF2786 domain-containing protein n=1 Tax=Pseudocercospora fuligena TaxID=685502 RepID=A0A8H6R7I8_9PEZI|nr:hypothetical protein HII31_13369 [Pseudocercospora fuligena]
MASRPPKPPLYKAIILESSTPSASARPHPDEAKIRKIQKCLNLCKSNSGSQGHEAKAATLLASRFMKQTNISMGELLATMTEEEKRNTSGHTTVRIVRNDGKVDGKVQDGRFVTRLSIAMKIFYDCAYIELGHTPPTKFDVIFYGVAENASSAAKAFVRIYNGVRQQAQILEFKGLVAKNSYCLGNASKLWDRAEAEKKAEEEAAKAYDQKEQTARGEHEDEKEQARLHRSNGPHQIGQKQVRGDNLLRYEEVDSAKGCNPHSSYRSGAFLRSLKIVAVNVFKGGPARPLRLTNAVNNHILDVVNLDPNFNAVEAGDKLEPFIEAGHFGTTEDGALVVVGSRMNRELGLLQDQPHEGSDTEPENDDDDDDDRGPQDADLYVDDTASVPEEEDTDDDDVEKTVAALARSFENDEPSANQSMIVSEATEISCTKRESHAQLMSRRKTFAEIEAEYLKKLGFKLAKNKKQKPTKMNWDAYIREEMDGEKIDVRQQKRIKV